MEGDLSALMTKIAAAEKDAKLTTEGPVRVAARMLDVPSSRDDFVSANRGTELQAQRTADMQGVLNALSQFVRFTADVGVVTDPTNYQRNGESMGVAMDAKYGNGPGDWRQNERAQQFALGLFAVMHSIRERYAELHRKNSLGNDAKETFTQALVELQRLAAGVQQVDHNTMMRLQKVGAELQRLQSLTTQPASRDFDELSLARRRAVGYLAAPHEERANPQHEPRYRGEQLLGR